MTRDDAGYGLQVTKSAKRRLNRLPESVAAAIVEFMLGALTGNPHRVGGQLRRELADLRSARRGGYRVVYEIDEAQLVRHHTDRCGQRGFGHGCVDGGASRAVRCGVAGQG